MHCESSFSLHSSSVFSVCCYFSRLLRSSQLLSLKKRWNSLCHFFTRFIHLYVLYVIAVDTLQPWSESELLHCHFSHCYNSNYIYSVFLPLSIVSRRLPCFRAVYERELNTTTMIWTSKTFWTMCNKRLYDILYRKVNHLDIFQMYFLYLRTVLISNVYMGIIVKWWYELILW